MQCGIACMAMICKYYGKGYSFETLSHLYTATTEGVSLLSLKKLGEEIGLETLCGRISPLTFILPLTVLNPISVATLFIPRSETPS